MADRSPQPRLGFLGVGWIGLNRMRAAHAAGIGVAAVADLDTERAQEAAAEVGCGTVCEAIDELLYVGGLDGIVIATPTALHADLAARALDAGLPVFCQKPLGRSAAECGHVIERARNHDLALGVDMSYRHVAAIRAALEAVRNGAIGEPHAAELVFHNAYGPDRDWVRDPALAGGGALTDLGWHLLDLARLFLGRLDPTSVQADLFVAGTPLDGDPEAVEDLALAQVRLAGGQVIRLACSWWLPAPADAVIEATFVGDGGSVSVRNVGGSFYDFEALLVRGRQREVIAAPPDEWGGRALIAWAERVRERPSYDHEVEELLDTASLVDRIYGRGE